MGEREMAGRVVLRDLRTPRMVALDRIGAWPGRKRGRGWTAPWSMTGLAATASALGVDGTHSVRVWDQTRQQVASRAGGLLRRNADAAGVLDFEFLRLLAEHATACHGAGCREWLAWGVSNSKLADVWEALGGEFQSVPPGLQEALERLRGGRAG